MAAAKAAQWVVLGYGSQPADTGGRGDYPALYVDTEAQGEQAIPHCTPVFLTVAFEHDSVLSKQSYAFVLKQSFIWAQIVKREG